MKKKHDVGHKMATAASSTTQVGRFEVTEDLAHQLGQGAYGTVYRAKDTRDNKVVAAKKQVIYKEYKHLADWEQEAKVLRKISQHENVIEIYDFTAVEFNDDGIAKIAYWMFTEYCEQRSLFEYAFKTKLTFSDRLDILYQSTSGVNHLHTENVVHRDLKPQNILVTTSGHDTVIKLCDFGEARSILIVNDATVTMDTANPFGTASYMAPEQNDQQDGKFLYKKSVDVFGFGVTGVTLLESRDEKFIAAPRGVKQKTLQIVLFKIHNEVAYLKYN